jgi:hypothetical protein
VLTITRIFLVGYQKLITIAVEQFQNIEEDMLQPFSHPQNIHSHALYHRRIITRDTWDVTVLAVHLESLILKKRRYLPALGFSLRIGEKVLAAFAVTVQTV